MKTTILQLYEQHKQNYIHPACIVVAAEINMSEINKTIFWDGYH